jgi:hypothetical protein
LEHNLLTWEEGRTMSAMPTLDSRWPTTCSTAPKNLLVSIWMTDHRFWMDTRNNNTQAISKIDCPKATPPRREQCTSVVFARSMILSFHRWESLFPGTTNEG